MAGTRFATMLVFIHDTFHPLEGQSAEALKAAEVCIISYSFGTPSTSISILIVSLKCSDGTRLFNNSLT